MYFSRHESTSRNDANDEQKYLRLFVIIPRSMTDKELTDEFSKFGRVEFANVVKDKETRESKGFGYVRYKK